jgi:CHAT domain-containing protein
VQQIVVSPDGELHRLPFAALTPTSDSFLIERFSFAYVVSGRDLAPAIRKPAAPSLDLVLVADADFGEGGRYPPLPGTAREAERIPPLVPGSGERKILRGKEATEAALKRLPASRILHIATHGFFLARETFGLEADGYDHSLVRSGLVLANANRPGAAAESDDGMLTALEVSGIDLAATELVVLSSCDSGAGSVTHGQGVLGLRRAFTLAGAKSVLMTLWPVDDELTARLIISFYRNTFQMPPASALHRAQIDALNDLKKRDGFADPRLWAAFLIQSAKGFESLDQAN